MNRNPSDHSDSEEDGYSSTEDEDDGRRRQRQSAHKICQNYKYWSYIILERLPNSYSNISIVTLL